MRETAAARAVAQPVLERLSEVLGARMGLHYPKERWSDLERGIAAAARAFGMPSAEACARWLVSAPLTQEQVEVLATHLTIGETYFFRERKSFEVLEAKVFPELLRARAASGRRLRVWSAGCCTGEEPYSIAMLLARMIPDPSQWNISILATDIDPAFLQKAARGVYGNWSFRDVPQSIKTQYFRKTAEGRFELAPHVRRMVTFAYLNLADDVYPALANGTNAMDLILCRNVLIYFEAARAREVLRKLARSLVDGGWLFVGPAEIPHVALPELARVDLDGMIAHRRARADAQRLPQRAPAGAAAASAGKPPRPAQRAAADSRARLRREAPAPAARPRDIARTQPEATAYSRAAQLYGEGRYGEAAAALLALLRDEPADAAAMTLLARASANQGRLADALEWCEKALQTNKLDAGCWFLLATILQELDRIEDAVSALRRSLYLDPDNPLAHYAFGNVMRRRGNAREAERHFRNALSALKAMAHDEVLAESEGMTAGRLIEVIESTRPADARA